MFGRRSPPPLPVQRTFPTFFVIFCCLHVSEHLWEQYLKLRTRWRLQQKGIPIEVHTALGGVDEAKYSLAQEYSAAKNSFAIVSSNIDLLQMMLDLAIQPYVWNVVTLAVAPSMLGLTAEHEIGRMVIGSLITLPLGLIFSLPLSAYSTFVIEEKYGFNKHTVRTWATDNLKELVVGMVLNLAMMVPLVMLLRNLGDSAWLFAWAFLTVFVLLMAMLYPVWIAPLFNTFKPLRHGELREGIEHLITQSGISCDKLFEIDGSRQSSHSNAYVTGFFGTKRIVIYDTLLSHLDHDIQVGHAWTCKHTRSTACVCMCFAVASYPILPTQSYPHEQEVKSVVAHEIGHAVLHHNYMQLAIITTQLFATFFTYGLCQTNKYLVTDFGFDSPCTYLTLHAFFLLYNSAVSPLMGPLMNGFTRSLEFAADRYSVHLGYDVRSALTKLSDKNLSVSASGAVTAWRH